VDTSRPSLRALEEDSSLSPSIPFPAPPPFPPVSSSPCLRLDPSAGSLPPESGAAPARTVTFRRGGDAGGGELGRLYQSKARGPFAGVRERGGEGVRRDESVQATRSTKHAEIHARAPGAAPHLARYLPKRLRCMVPPIAASS
jgi:hypothetical protein